MKNKIVHIILFSLLTLMSPPAGSAFAEDGRYYIRVKSTKLRSAPKHFASAVADLKLADSVTGVKAADGWYQVTTASKKSGYLHEAVLSDKKIITDARKGYNPSADSSDVVLAGKGFNKEVERDFASKNPNLNFADVNQMDRISVSDSELISFVKNGGLNKNG